MDFSYQSYRTLLQGLLYNNYSIRLIGTTDSSTEKNLYLRHDVDTDYLGVLPLARIEFELGMKSTWYFLPDCPVYNLCSKQIKQIITELHTMGHQVGLHIDATRYTNQTEMIASVNEYYVFFSKFLPISKTLSFHKPAPWLLNDVFIPEWVNAYQKEFYSNVVYVSDSNRREFWNEDRLSMAIKDQRSLTLLTHPLWWKETSLDSEEVFNYCCKILGEGQVSSYLIDTCKRYSNRDPLVEEEL